MASSAPLAIIAGVGPGTGASVARRFAQAYSVVLLSRKSSTFQPLVDEINKNGGKAIGYETDVTDEKSIGETFEKIEKEGGKVAVSFCIVREKKRGNRSENPMKMKRK